MNNKLALKTITPRDIWNVFRGCMWYVLIAVVVVTGVSYAYAKYTYVPVYSSSATIYLINMNEKAELDENGEIIETSGFDIAKYNKDYTIAMRVIPDVVYILKSSKVVNAVSEDLGYSVSSGNIRIENPEETRVLQITTTASSPEKAKEIADSVCTVGAKVIKDMIEYDTMYIFQKASLNPYPSNSVSLTSSLKFGIVAGALVFLVFLAMFLFDNYIHTEEDIERYLGLTILGDIPDANAPKKKNKYSRYKEDKWRENKKYYKSRYESKTEQTEDKE